MKIIIFGLGKFYNKRKHELEDLLGTDTIVALIDNNADGIGFCGRKKVLRPNDVGKKEYDLIVIMSVYFDEMKNQLLDLGVEPSRIRSYDDYRSMKSQGIITEHIVEGIPNDGKKVILISSEMGINGATIAIVNAAIALRLIGIYACIASHSNPSKVTINEINSKGIDVFIFQSYPYIGGKDFDFVKKFDVVVVNIFQSIKFAYECSKFRPVLWWVHESPDIKGNNIYTRIRRQFSELDSTLWMDNVYVAGVSSVAEKAFESIYPGMASTNFPYGLIDEHINPLARNTGEKIVFSIIGYVYELKAQDLFIIAAKKLLQQYPDKLVFWIVGSFSENDYYHQLLDLIGDCADIQFTGEKNRQEMLEIYSQTDICVCASRIECLQIVTVEGMMHEKLCITTDASGITDYITDGENGLVFESGNVDALYEKMRWAVEHYGDSQYESICHKGRETYEKYFTMEVFGDRLEKELLEAKKKFEANNTEAN